MVKKIVVITTDGIIWNKEEFLIDLTVAMAQAKEIQIDFNTEGPDLRSLNIYEYIENIAKQTNYDLSKLTITTGNVFEQHSTIKLTNQFPWMYTNWGKENCSKSPQAKVFDHNFKTAASFVSRSNWNRLKLSSYLYKNYPSKILQSYHYDHTNAYHNDNIGVENLIKNNYISRIGDVTNLWEHCPLTLDKIYQYPIVNPNGYSLIDNYQHFFVEVVMETYSIGDTFFPTEKIWRPISQLTPFMVQGPQWYIVRLRKLGFKTFDRWWDEGYSEDHYAIQSDQIEKNIDYLTTLSTVELEQMYKDMMPILEHNRNRLITITQQEIKQAFTI
jgi:hypothetical protein